MYIRYMYTLYKHILYICISWTRDPGQWARNPGRYVRYCVQTYCTVLRTLRMALLGATRTRLPPLQALLQNSMANRIFHGKPGGEWGGLG